jgi:hypothetical protein
MTGFRLADDSGVLRIGYGRQELASYVYRPPEPQRESPRPYWHPVRTLAGDLVTRCRPDDHVWHKGLSWSLPNVGTENFWGGTTYRRGQGYVQLPNNGAMVHQEFTGLAATVESATVEQRLAWVTQSGATCFDEQRGCTVSLASGGWALAFRTRFTNRTGGTIRIGSPTTEGRDNAGYGGLFWRGPEHFTGGTVRTPQATGGDELMGVRAPWLAYTGPDATLVFVDGPGNPGHPTRWFVRAHPFAGVCPAPFFDTETPVPPGGTVALRYAVVVAGGDPGPAGAAELAAAGRTLLEQP